MAITGSLNELAFDARRDVRTTANELHDLLMELTKDPSSERRVEYDLTDGNSETPDLLRFAAAEVLGQFGLIGPVFNAAILRRYDNNHSVLMESDHTPHAAPNRFDGRTAHISLTGLAYLFVYERGLTHPIISPPGTIVAVDARTKSWVTPPLNDTVRYSLFLGNDVSRNAN